MATDSRVLSSSPPLVALASWLLPGLGYFLIGQRGRALAVGITIILLFIAGLLIGGVRVIEVPGYSVNTGERAMVIITREELDRATGKVVTVAVPAPVIDPVTGQPVVDADTGRMKMQPMKRWALAVAPLNEIRDKPWSVPQVMTGPIAIAAGAWSVYAAGTVQDPLKPAAPKHSIGESSHSRINELGSLYLSVAGLLNLMVIIDATWRAVHLNPKPAEATE